MKKSIISLIIGLFINQLAFADTLIVSETTDGIFTAWSNDKYIRGRLEQNKTSTNESMPPGDMFNDFQSGKMYLILDKEKLIIDMAPPAFFAGLQGKPKSRKVKIQYKNKGSGKTIAGLTTTKYDIIVEGKKCFEALLTKNKAYAAEIEKYNSLNTPEADAHDICEQADNQMDQEKDSKYGYPVKMTDANGQLQILLKEFKTNQTAPKNYLTFPKGYKVSTMMEAAGTLMKMQSNNQNN